MSVDGRACHVGVDCRNGGCRAAAHDNADFADDAVASTAFDQMPSGYDSVNPYCEEPKHPKLKWQNIQYYKGLDVQSS